MLISCHTNKIWLHFLLACSKKMMASIMYSGNYSDRQHVDKKQEKDLKSSASAFCCHFSPALSTCFLSSGSFSHMITRGSRKKNLFQTGNREKLANFLYILPFSYGQGLSVKHGDSTFSTQQISADLINITCLVGGCLMIKLSLH